MIFAFLRFFGAETMQKWFSSTPKFKVVYKVRTKNKKIQRKTMPVKKTLYRKFGFFVTCFKKSVTFKFTKTRWRKKLHFRVTTIFESAVSFFRNKSKFSKKIKIYVQNCDWQISTFCEKKSMCKTQHVQKWTSKNVRLKMYV